MDGGEGFLKDKKLSLHRGDGTCHLRLSAINKDTLNHYYDLLEDVLETQFHGPP